MAARTLTAAARNGTAQTAQLIALGTLGSVRSESAAGFS